MKTALIIGLVYVVIAGTFWAISKDKDYDFESSILSFMFSIIWPVSIFLAMFTLDDD